METSMAERLEQAVATLNDMIALTGSAGMPDTAQFLAMAKLHLLIEVNEVTDAEFRALCDADRDPGLDRTDITQEQQLERAGRWKRAWPNGLSRPSRR